MTGATDLLIQTAITLNQIIQSVTSDGFYQGYASTFYNDAFLSKELYSEFLLLLVQLNYNKLLRLFSSHQLKYYCVSIIKNLVYNKYSPFNKNHINKNLSLEDSYMQIENASTDPQPAFYDKESLLDEIGAYMENKEKSEEGFWYQKKLFEMYHYQKLTYRQISAMTNIPVSSIFNTIKSVKDSLKEEFADKYNELNKESDL